MGGRVKDDLRMLLSEFDQIQVSNSKYISGIEFGDAGGVMGVD